MDPESANGVVARLKNDKVPYTLDEGGRTIRVPVARLDELRLQVAGQGMPASGRIGFEIFDRTSLRRDRLPRARELPAGARRRAGAHDRHDCGSGERARAHRDGAAVAVRVSGSGGDRVGRPQAARQQAARRRRRPRPSRDWLPPASKGCGRKRSSSSTTSAGRSPDSTDGRDEAAGALQVERQQRIERDLSARVVSLLEPIVGPAHVRVNISAKLNIDSQEETVERFDPTRGRSAVIRAWSRAARRRRRRKGVAGVRSNMPPPAVDRRRATLRPCRRRTVRRRWPRRRTRRR